MKTVNSLATGRPVPKKSFKWLLFTVLSWYHNFAFRTACKVYESRISYFEMEGHNLEPFIFTGSLRIAYQNLVGITSRHSLPMVPFESFVQMLQSGKPVRFQKSSRWISLVAYLHP